MGSEFTFFTRLAPTPSGFLHPGNGVSMVATWALARANHGQVLLRIDDLDKARRRPEFIADVFDTLHWLGLDYDDGPTQPDDFLARWSQHLRLPSYLNTLERLRQTGLLYACDCSRKNVLATSVDGRYTGHCRQRGLPLDAPRVAWRIAVDADALVSCANWQGQPVLLAPAQLMGDFVVRQRDGFPAYQIASLTDDLMFGINRIVRGQDLLPSTAAQLYLATVLDETNFVANTRFWHHPLLTDDQGEKLSKSSGATALAAWRNSGRPPVELYQLAASWLGLSAVTDIHSPHQLAEACARQTQWLDLSH